MISAFPAAWLQEKSFAANQSLAIVCALAFWSGLSTPFLAASLPASIADSDLIVLLLVALIAALVAFRLQRGLFDFLGRLQSTSAVLVYGPTSVFAATGVAVGFLFLSKFGSGARSLGFLLAVEVALSLTAPASRSLLRHANIYAPGSPDRLAIQHNLAFPGRLNSFARLAVPVVRGLAHLVAWAIFALYAAWAFLILLITRSARAFVEENSFICEAPRCYLPFDDPELGCRCGRGQFRNFPRLRRPWLAACTACKRTVGVWRSTKDLIADDQAQFSFAFCKACRNAIRRRKSIVIVPVDGFRAARFEQMARRLDADFVMTPADRVIWAGDADAVFLAVRNGPFRHSDVQFALNHVGLPSSEQQWEDVPPSRPRGRIARLIGSPRRDPHPTSYGRRRMPTVAILDGDGTEIVTRSAETSDKALQALLGGTINER